MQNLEEVKLRQLVKRYMGRDDFLTSDELVRAEKRVMQLAEGGDREAMSRLGLTPTECVRRYEQGVALSLPLLDQVVVLQHGR